MGMVMCPPTWSAHCVMAMAIVTVMAGHSTPKAKAKATGSGWPLEEVREVEQHEDQARKSEMTPIQFHPW